MKKIIFPVNLYCTGLKRIETFDLCRGENDFRKVYIVDDGTKKIVIKHCSNVFADERRIEGWIRLMEAYNKLGIYCPAIIPNINGELIHKYTEGNRDYYVFAEEYAKYDTAERIGGNKIKDNDGNSVYIADVMRSIGKVANARLDVVDWCSAYCLIETFPGDDTDEATECAETFADFVKDELPEFYGRTQKLLDLFYKNKNELSRVYSLLPTSCFQADISDNNVLLDDSLRFVGLIDFNLSGREPVLNYAIREALWGVHNSCLFGKKGSRLYFYSKELDDVRMKTFFENIKYIQEYYEFCELEREVFPTLFRYMNSFWWHHIEEIKKVKKDKEKVSAILDWLEYQMTRDDIRLP